MRGPERFSQVLSAELGILKAGNISDVPRSTLTNPSVHDCHICTRKQSWVMIVGLQSQDDKGNMTYLHLRFAVRCIDQVVDVTPWKPPSP